MRESSKVSTSFPESWIQKVQQHPLCQAFQIQMRRHKQGAASARMRLSSFALTLEGSVSESALMALGGWTSRLAILTMVGPGRQILPLEHRVSLMNFAHEGELIAKARVEHLRMRVVHCSYRILDEDGELIATGGFVADVLPRQQLPQDEAGVVVQAGTPSRKPLPAPLHRAKFPAPTLEEPRSANRHEDTEKHDPSKTAALFQQRLRGDDVEEDPGDASALDITAKQSPPLPPPTSPTLRLAGFESPRPKSSPTSEAPPGQESPTHDLLPGTLQDDDPLEATMLSGSMSLPDLMDMDDPSLPDEDTERYVQPPLSSASKNPLRQTLEWQADEPTKSEAEHERTDEILTEGQRNGAHTLSAMLSDVKSSSSLKKPPRSTPVTGDFFDDDPEESGS